MPIIKTKGISLYYEIHGTGYPLILILGMGMNVANFNNPLIIEQFAKKYQVIAFDNRGLGRSDKPEEPFTVEQMAEDTINLMDALSIPRAHIVGGSLGGCVAQVIAANHPDRVNGLVLHGTASRYPLKFRILLSLIMNVSFMKKKSLQMAEPIFKEPYPPTEISYLNQCVAGVAYNRRDLLTKITAPTLILSMRSDQFVPEKNSRELAEGIAGSKLEYIDKDHLFLLREPELVIQPSLAFLEEVDTRDLT